MTYFPKQSGANLLHNGAMQVHQRGVSASGLTTSNWYTADRWYLNVSSLGEWTATVESDAPTGSGFRKSLKLLCTTADASPDDEDYVMLRQRLEGQDVQVLRKGTAEALPVTLSFWTKSSKTGTYVALLYDNNNNRHVSAAYTVTSSGVWEYQSVTFPGDATGSFTNDEEAALSVEFWLGAGSNYTSGTLGTTWGVTPANRAPGLVNVGAVSGDYLQVTGIQLEAGSVASTFDHKSYATELRECQRYYWRHWSDSAVSGNVSYVGVGQVTSTTAAYVQVPMPVSMRDIPSASAAGAVGVGSYWVSGVAATSLGTYGGSVRDLVTVTLANTNGTWATTTVPAMITVPASTGGTYLAFSADI